jgi:O-6-methylguanine DNA methyltransferase
VSGPRASWTSIPGPWGPFHLAATARGVVAVDWFTTTERFEARLMKRLGGPIECIRDGADDGPVAGHLRTGINGLHRLLDGATSDLDIVFDLADRPEWDRRVLGAVATIPWGRTRSYGDIARQIGAPRAARAVGGAVGRNPIGLLIPCHRVIAGDGTIGGYGGDAWGSREERLEIKRELLRREGTLAVGRTIDSD